MPPRGAQPSDAMQLYDHIIHWMPWVEAALLGILLLASAIQPHALSQCLHTIAAPIQRRYSMGGNSPLAAWIQKIYQLGTIALAILIGVAAYMGHTETLTIRQYLMVMGILVIVWLVKHCIDKWIQITFQFALHEQTYYAYQSNLWLVMSMILWAMVLVSEWLSVEATWLIPVAVWIVYWCILWWKIMQALGWHILHIGYSILYMLHLEILPTAIAVLGVAYLLKQNI